MAIKCSGKQKIACSRETILVNKLRETTADEDVKKATLMMMLMLMMMMVMMMAE